MESRFVLGIVSRLLIPFILMFGCYIQLHGDYSPGGGFQAGVICAASFILYGVIHGAGKTLKVLPFPLIKALCCLGPLTYAGVGFASLIKGGEFLNYSVLAADPIHGQHLGILIIELGVGFTVFAVMMMIYLIFAKRKGYIDASN